MPLLCSLCKKSNPSQHKAYLPLKSHSDPECMLTHISHNTPVDAMAFWHKQRVLGVNAPFLACSWLDGYLYGQGDLSFFRAFTPSHPLLFAPLTVSLRNATWESFPTGDVPLELPLMVCFGFPGRGEVCFFPRAQPVSQASGSLLKTNRSQCKSGLIC